MNWNPTECKKGDMIRVKVGSFYHYGIFVSDDEVIQFGLPPAPQYAEERTNKEITVISTDIDIFACGSIIEVAEFTKKEMKEKFSEDETVSRAKARLGEGGYNILHNNCEHFAYEVCFGKKLSTQEEKAKEKWRLFKANKKS